MIVQIKIPVASWSEGFTIRQVLTAMIESYGFEIDGYGYGVQKERVHYIDVNMLINIYRDRPVIFFDPKAFKRLWNDIQSEYPTASFGTQKRVEDMLALKFPTSDK